MTRRHKQQQFFDARSQQLGSDTQQQQYFDARSQLEPEQQFFDALSFHDDESPTLTRKPKRGQTPYVKSLNLDNMNILKSCIDTLPIVDSVLDFCRKNKVHNIYLVDGPNMGYQKSATFSTRQAFLSGKKFRKVLIDNMNKDNKKSLFLIVSQKSFRNGKSISPSCNNMLHVSNIIGQNQHFFLNMKVACYDKNTKNACMVSNETDDYVRKYLSNVLALKCRTTKNHITLYEISNDKSRNWLVDKKINIPRIAFPRTIFYKKPPIVSKTILPKRKTPTPKTTTTNKTLTMIWRPKRTITKMNTQNKQETIRPIPTLKVRPLYSHINMPSGTALQFGINPQVSKGLVQRLNTIKTSTSRQYKKEV